MVRTAVGWVCAAPWEAGCAGVGLARRRRLAVKGERHTRTDAANSRECASAVQPCVGFGGSSRSPNTLCTPDVLRFRETR